MAYRVADLRNFDRALFSEGRARRSRYIEVEPNCWLCPAVGTKRTREHVFGQWIMKELPEDLLYFTPIRTGPFGDAESDKRGPMHLRTLQVRRLCRACNGGWMSKLEARVKPMLFGVRRKLDASQALTLAHWALKTAVVLNVSQPSPLVWPEADRHRIKSGPFERTFVSLLRVSGRDINWLQGEGVTWVGPMGPLVLPVLALMPNARIRINDIVLVTARLPWQIAKSSVSMPGSTIWDGQVAHDIDLDDLPLATSWMEGTIDIEGVTSSAFWREPPLDFWAADAGTARLGRADEVGAAGADQGRSECAAGGVSTPPAFPAALIPTQTTGI